MNRISLSEAKLSVESHIKDFQLEEVIEFFYDVFAFDMYLVGLDEVSIEGDIYSEKLFKLWVQQFFDDMDENDIIDGISAIEGKQFELDPEDDDFIVDLFLDDNDSEVSDSEDIF